MAETIENLLQEMEAYARARQVPILTEAARPVFLRTVRAAAVFMPKNGRVIFWTNFLKLR